MKILITGASGFVGRHVVARLTREGHSLRAMVRRLESLPPAVEQVLGDVTEPESVRRAVASMEAVVHLAARVHDVASPDDELITHQGTANVVRAAEEAGIRRFVLMSTVAVYGRFAPTLCDETTPPSPTSSYGAAKLMAEEALFRAAAPGGWHATVLRPANVYGVGCKGNIPKMIEAVRRRMFPPPPRKGTPRNFVSADDLAEAVYLALTRDEAAGKVFNVVDDAPMTVRQMYDLIIEALGRSPQRWEVPVEVFHAAGALGDRLGRLLHRPMPFDSERCARFFGGPAPMFDASRIRGELGFVARQTFASEIPKMLNPASAASL